MAASGLAGINGSVGGGRVLTTLAGLPAATAPWGMSRVTIEQAPTTALCPMVTPGPTKAPAQTQTPSPMTMGGRMSGMSMRV